MYLGFLNIRSFKFSYSNYMSPFTAIVNVMIKFTAIVNVMVNSDEHSMFFAPRIVL